jgi:hypothetical protein
MPKPSKHILTWDDEIDYDLIGICCHQKDYRLCWGINEELGFMLSKAEEPFMVSGKKGEVLSSHSFYEWTDCENYLQYYLIKNKDNNKFLIPEKAQIDYFLVIQDAGMVELDVLLTQLKKISSILTALIIDPSTLPSKNRLVF